MTTSEQTTEGTAERSTETSTERSPERTPEPSREATESRPQEAGAGEQERAGQPTEVEKVEHHRMRGAVQFARRHPFITLAGATGASMFGGLELAAGVLVGAGVARFLRSGNGRAPREKIEEARGRLRSALDRLVPGELRARTRAVVDAARGKSAPAA